jgi:flagellar secretion chaperone FliS
MNAYANPGKYADVYKKQQVGSAAPEQLTLMLYSGAVRFVTENIKAVAENRLDDAHKAHLRAQDIVVYLMETLDMQYDISHNLFQLYEYIKFRLNEANLKKDAAQLEEAKGLLVELRDTWSEAMKKARAEKTPEERAASNVDHAGAVKLTLQTTDAPSPAGK